MARTLDLSILEFAQDRNSGLNRRLRRWLRKQLRQLQPLLILSAEGCQAERYRKHFHSFAHACLLIFHGLSGSPSLRQSYAAFAACQDMATLSGLKVSSDPDDERLSVSFSQFAESNSSRPAAFLAGIIPPLAGQLRKLSPAFPIPTHLHLLDSTFLRLSLKLST